MKPQRLVSEKFVPLFKIVIFYFVSQSACADCLMRGNSFEEGSQVGVSVCENGNWTKMESKKSETKEPVAAVTPPQKGVGTNDKESQKKKK